MNQLFPACTVAVLTAAAMAQSTQSALPRITDAQIIPDAIFTTQDQRGTTPAVPTAFTYQGRLDDNGNPANGQYDMRFALLDEAGVPVTGIICFDNILVTDGLFTIQLDFGSQFTGASRRLGTAVRPGGPLGNCADPAGYTNLTPSQPLTPTPYALGLRLPFTGTQNIPDGPIISVTNESSSPSSIGVLATLQGPATFPFTEPAAVRGETSHPLGFGVLGISQTYGGVLGYTPGTQGIGVAGRADGPSGRGVVAIATGPGGVGLISEGTDFAGAFFGRTYLSGPVGINLIDPETELDVNGTIKANALRITDNAQSGRLLVSDSVGNAVWTRFNAGFRSDAPPAVPVGTGFLSTTVILEVAAGQRVLVIATQALGSTLLTGGTGMNILIGLQNLSGGPISVRGGGLFGLRVPQNSRIPFSLSAVIEGLPAGTYRFGMVSQVTTSADAGSWNNNDWGYVTAVTLP